MSAEARRDELMKGAVHLAVFALAAMCFGHNLKECCKRPSWQHGVNATVYFGALFFEGRHVRDHFRSAAA